MGQPIRKAQPVDLVTGGQTQVQTDAEATWWNEARAKYMAQLKFDQETDLKDLDRLLLLELMVFRFGQQLSAGEDYDGDWLVNEKQMIQDLKLYSDQINKVKESMGLNKKARDAVAQEGNFVAWLSDLKQRAKIFGVHRENQLTTALVLMNRLSACITTFDRADAEERAKFGFPDEHSILEWVRTTMLPEFRAVDEHFRAHEHRYWIREM